LVELLLEKQRNYSKGEKKQARSLKNSKLPKQSSEKWLSSEGEKASHCSCSRLLFLKGPLVLWFLSISVYSQRFIPYFWDYTCLWRKHL